MSDTLNSNINTGLVIDPVTRSISLKDGKEKIFVAKNDHNSTVLTFEIPKIIDGHDMSGEDTLIYIHFLNMSGEDVSKTLGGVSEVTSTAFENEDTLSFYWRIPKIATGYAGILSLGITFECYDNVEGSVEEVYSWSSAPFSDIVVCDSLDEGKREVKREYNHLVETCNAIVEAALKGEMSYLVDDALKKAKESGDFDGDKGERGEGWVVRGYYTSLDKLMISVEGALQGDTYAVGKSEPYTYYSYDNENGWVNLGTFSPVLAESYARGGTGVREGEDLDNAKFYCEKAEKRLENTANALKATASGVGSVKIKDISPFEHNMTVRVTSPMNIPLLPYKFGSTGEIGGVHADINDDGSIRVNGISHAEEGGKNTVLSTVFLEAGIYKVSFERSSSNVALEFLVSEDINFNRIIASVESLSDKSVNTIFTLNQSQHVYIGIKTDFVKGESYDFTFKPKLSVGKIEAYDLSELKYIRITDSEDNRTVYNCSARADDTSFSMTVRSISDIITVETDERYSFNIELEYNADTNISNDRFCQAVEGKEAGHGVVLMEDVSSNRHFVDLNLKASLPNRDVDTFRVLGTNLLNVGECEMANCDISGNTEASGFTLKNHVDTYGIELMPLGYLWEVFYYIRESRVFTFSTSTKLSANEYMAARFTYDDGSEVEFTGEKGASSLTFTYVPNSDSELSFIYLYPRKQDEPFTTSKSVTGLQFEVGEKTPYQHYFVKEYTVNEDDIEETYATIESNSRILSIAPKMTVTSAEATTATVSYKRDINKIIEELQNAILSLGGNI